MLKRRKVEIVPVPPSLKFAPNTEVWNTRSYAQGCGTTAYGQQVWEITQTGELFTNYEAYLERYDLAPMA
jgi:hypothetical protein